MLESMKYNCRLNRVLAIQRCKHFELGARWEREKSSKPMLHLLLHHEVTTILRPLFKIYKVCTYLSEPVHTTFHKSSNTWHITALDQLNTKYFQIFIYFHFSEKVQRLTRESFHPWVPSKIPASLSQDETRSWEFNLGVPEGDSDPGPWWHFRFLQSVYHSAFLLLCMHPARQNGK